MLTIALWHTASTALFATALWSLRTGFRGAESWVALMFAINFSGNVLAIPLALLGYQPYEWILDAPATAEYGLIVLTAMLSFISGHLVMAPYARTWRWSASLPAIRFSRKNFAVIIYALSAVGAFMSIALSANGYNGYFTNALYNYEPPAWLDVAKIALNAQLALSFFVVLRDVKSEGRLRFATLALCLAWVISGLIAGYKSQVIVPGIFVLIASWLGGRTRARYIAALPLLLVLAYLVVEPLREFRTQLTHDNALLGLRQMINSDATVTTDESAFIDQFVRRVDYGETAVAVLEAEERGQLVRYADRLSETYRLIIPLAFVPRALWPEKPLSDLGRELSIDILDIDTNSITPSQPVASFLWARWLGVFLNNFILGAIVSIAGLLISRYREDPLGYLPILMCAFALSTGDTVMANYYVVGARYVFATLLVYLFLVTVRGRRLGGTPASRLGTGTNK